MKKLTFIVFGLLLGFMMHAASPKYNYGEVLQKSLFFYEAQQAGPLPDWNRVSWRGDACVNDGEDVGLDLNGGWFDAGDHVKFNFPMAWTVTTLAWGGLEFKQGYQDMGQLEILKRNLKFVTDYFIKCHPEPNVLWGQVGNGGLDHGWWGSAEVYHLAGVDRPSYKIDAEHPGSDLAGETAAAMAATSMLLKEDDPTYAAELIRHAKEIYDFAYNYRGKYPEAITDATTYYNSWSGYYDELVYAACWLYKATGEEKYLDYAKKEYPNLNQEGQEKVPEYIWAGSWDDKGRLCHYLMYELTGEATYKENLERHLDYWVYDFNKGDDVVTRGGLYWSYQWGPLRYTANVCILLQLYADMAPASKKADYQNFVVNQINYMLGDNPRQSSYVCGFGKNPPVNPHHRTVHGTWGNGFSKAPNPSRHTLYGALVGGPLSDDSYEDDRGNYFTNEVACDYNASFTSVLAGLCEAFDGCAPLANFPIEEEPVDEFYCAINDIKTQGNTTSVKVFLHNHSAWPARGSDKLSTRYYVDLSEGFDAGLTLADYTVSNNSAGKLSNFQACDEANHIYYIEIDLSGKMYAPIGDGPSVADIQFNIGLKSGVTGAWNPDNDFSYVEGSYSTKDEGRNYNMPVFDDGNYVGGFEPDACAVGAYRPRAKFSTTPTLGMNPMTVKVDASESTGPEGAALTYAWDFGDGSKGAGKTASHVYADPGNYVITLVVTANGESSSPKTSSVTVKDKNSPPVASFTANATNGVAPLAVDFDASASYVANGEELTYSWNFGDGKTASGVKVSHTFTGFETFTVELTVTSSTGTSKATKTITVKDPDLVGNVKLLIKVEKGDDAQIPITIQMANEGDDAVSLDEMVIRYWVTMKAEHAVAIRVDNDGGIGKDNIKATLVKLKNAAENATHYIELSFASGAGQLAANSSTGEINFTLHVEDYYPQDFDRANSYSQINAPSSLQEYDNITIYQNEILIGGIEPKFSNNGSVSVKETEISKVSVFPNPSKGEAVNVVLGSGEESVVTVYNLAGTLVLQATAQNKLTIPAGKLDVGIYVISIQSESVTENIKLVVK